MVRVNQKVADEIVTLVARHRYAVEDSKDALKAAEAASKARNEELARQSADKREEIAKLAESVKAQHGEAEKQTWATRERSANEISLGDDDEYEEPPAQPPRATYSATPPAPPEPAASPEPAPAKPVRPSRRRQAFEEDDDYENASWLR